MTNKLSTKKLKKQLEDERDRLIIFIDDLQIELEGVDEKLKKLYGKKTGR